MAVSYTHLDVYKRQAHHYLEKQAMDQRIRRWQAAQNIVEAIKKEGEQQ